MEKVLVIYDMEGKIYQTMGGDVQEPTGIPFMWVEIPQGSYITKIDVSKDIHEPIFVDYPKSEVVILQEQVDALNIAIAQMMGV